MSERNGVRVGVIAVAVWLSGCAAIEHDCYEMRNCPRTDAGSDAGAGGADAGDESAGAPQSLFVGRAGSAGSALSDAAAPDIPPSIVSVSPSDGAVGVAEDGEIVIVFSQAMDRQATEAAYESEDLPSAAVSVTWSDDDTTLTLRSLEPLRYSQTVPAREYRWGFGDRARDRLGRALPAQSFRFSTLREATLDVPVDPERTGNWTSFGSEGINNCLRKPLKASYAPTVCVGDDLYDARYVGLLSFDLSALPANVVAFSSVRLLASATLHGSPDKLGASRFEHVSFDELGDAALSSAGSLLGPIYGGQSFPSKTQLELSFDLTRTLSDDFRAGSSRSQYRLRFERGSENGVWDDLELPTSQIRLSVVYLVP